MSLPIGSDAAGLNKAGVLRNGRVVSIFYVSQTNLMPETLAMKELTFRRRCKATRAMQFESKLRSPRYDI